MPSIIFWQNIPSIHQAPLVREIARQWPNKVTVITEWDISSERLSQGWSRPNYGDAKLIISPDDTARENIIKSTKSDKHIHIFSGIDAYPKCYKAFLSILNSPARIGILGEPGKGGNPIKRALRKLHYKYNAIKFRQKINFILATGQSGVDWYSASGFKNESIYPFAYFVASDLKLAPIKESRAAFSFLFIGELKSHKAVDLIIDALAKVDEKKFEILIVGQGPEQEALQEKARKLGVESRISWLGTLPNAKVQTLLTTVDCLILPSRFDGWGAVVNEALTAGTPAIVSTACGASELIRSRLLGKVFTSDDSDSLAICMLDQLKSGKLPPNQRSKISKWAEAHISPRVAAQYLIEIISQPSTDSPKPEAPWRSNTNSLDPEKH